MLCPLCPQVRQRAARNLGDLAQLSMRADQLVAGACVAWTAFSSWRPWVLALACLLTMRADQLVAGALALQSLMWRCAHGSSGRLLLLCCA